MKTNQKNGFETTPQRGYIEANKSDLNALHELGKWNDSTHHLKQQLIKEQSDTVDSYTGLKIESTMCIKFRVKLTEDEINTARELIKDGLGVQILSVDTDGLKESA